VKSELATFFDVFGWHDLEQQRESEGYDLVLLGRVIRRR